MTKISLGREVADSEQDGPYQPDPKAGRRLFQVGCVGVAALIAWNVHRSPVSDPLLLGAGVAMIALGALPSLLWALRSSTHFPVFEVFLLTFVPFYGLSLLAGHPEVMTFDDDATTGAAVAVLLFQGAALAAYYGTSAPAVRTPLLTMPLVPDAFMRFAQAGLWLNSAYIYLNGFTQLIPYELSLPLRATFFGIGNIAIYLEMRRWGSGGLTGTGKLIVAGNLLLQCVLLTRELYLIVALSLLLVSAIAYLSTSRRIPWLGIMIVLPVAAVLHNGKSAMRSAYWDGGDAMPSLTDLPNFYSRWLEAGLQPREAAELRGNASLTSQLVERASLFHMLCLVVERTPEQRPFLNGESYSYIPSQLVPAFLWPGKPSSLKSNVLLAVHYRLVPEDGTARVSIAFGMVSESYANFGYWGCAIAGTMLGLFYRRVSAAATGAPQFSAVGLLGILLGAWSFQTEQIFATWIVSLLQATSVVIALPLAFRMIFPASFLPPPPAES